jgi:hypothetical protein
MEEGTDRDVTSVILGTGAVVDMVLKLAEVRIWPIITYYNTERKKLKG